MFTLSDGCAQCVFSVCMVSDNLRNIYYQLHSCFSQPFGGTVWSLGQYRVMTRFRSSVTSFWSADTCFSLPVATIAFYSLEGALIFDVFCHASSHGSKKPLISCSAVTELYCFPLLGFYFVGTSSRPSFPHNWHGSSLALPALDSTTRCLFIGQGVVMYRLFILTK